MLRRKINKEREQKVSGTTRALDKMAREIVLRWGHLSRGLADNWRRLGRPRKQQVQRPQLVCLGDTKEVSGAVVQGRRLGREGRIRSCV